MAGSLAAKRRYVERHREAIRYRRDLNDWIEVCVSCHRKMDMTDQKRRKIGEANRARVVSAETRAKLSAAAKRRWEQSRGS
jgi:hypothetical protein